MYEYESQGKDNYYGCELKLLNMLTSYCDIGTSPLFLVCLSHTIRHLLIAIQCKVCIIHPQKMNVLFCQQNEVLNSCTTTYVEYFGRFEHKFTCILYCLNIIEPHHAMHHKYQFHFTLPNYGKTTISAPVHCGIIRT